VSMSLSVTALPVENGEEVGAIHAPFGELKCVGVEESSREIKVVKHAKMLKNRVGISRRTAAFGHFAPRWALRLGLSDVSI